MNLPTEMGRYRGIPADWGVSEQGDSKIPTFSCRFDLTQFLRGNEWDENVAQEGLEISGFFYLFKKNGEPNTFTINALKESLGWDGRSIASLNDCDWSPKGVQLTIAEETYNNKTRAKVQFINPWDYAGGGGGVEKSDPQTVRMLDSTYGAKLRALSGGNGAAATPTDPAEQAKRLAWETFKETTPELDVPGRTGQWLRDLAAIFPGKDTKKLTAGEWAMAMKKFKDPKETAATTPFGDENVFKEEEIPF